MTNLERLKMEIKGVKTPDEELEIYLMENDLESNIEYVASNTNKKAIYQTALSVLESIANNPSMMKDYKTKDISVSNYHENLLKQIESLNIKIRNMVDDDYVSENDAQFINIFR